MGQRGWIRRAIEAPAATDEASDEVPAATPAVPTPEASIAAGCELEGRLQLEGPLTVYGDFKGEIHCHEDVIVASTGTVQGPIHARSVEVLGSVVGDLHARREIVLHAGGRLHGDVSTASLVVERGSCFEGHSRQVLPIAPRPLPQDPAPRDAASGDAATARLDAASGDAAPAPRESAPGSPPSR